MARVADQPQPWKAIRYAELGDSLQNLAAGGGFEPATKGL